MDSERVTGTAVEKQTAEPEIPALQVCVMGQNGDMIVRVFEDGATLTIRNPQKEQRAEVELTAHQAAALSDVLLRIPCADCGEMA